MLRFSKWLDQVGQQVARPRHAAFEEGEAQLGEAGHRPAEEQRPAHGLGAGGEVADVVGHVVGGRHAAAEADAGGVEGGGDAELGAALPHRVVVVGAVEAEAVDPAGGAVALVARRRAQHQPAEEEALEPQLAGGVVELGDGLVGVVGRDDPDGDQPVGVRAVGLGVVAVAGPGEGAAQLGVVDRHDRQADGGVEHGDVDAQLVEAFVEQPGEHGGGPVEGVAGGHAPPAGARQAVGPAGLDVEAAAQRATTWTSR